MAKLVSKGVDCLKVYENLSPEALAAVLRAGREAGLPVLGHVPRSRTFAESGIGEVEHLTGLLDPPLARDLPRSEWLVELARRWRDVDVGIIDRYVRVSRSQGVRHVPTLVSFRHDALQASFAAQSMSSTARMLPNYWRRVLWNPDRDERLRGLSAADWSALQVAYERRLAVVGALHRSGVEILAGTDVPNPFVVPGASLHEELRLLVEAGLSPVEAWAAATTKAGEILGLPGLGRIEAGAPADLLVFARDPTRDLAALESLEIVVADGRLYRVDELRAATHARQRQFDGRVYDLLTRSLVRFATLFVR